MEKSMPMLEIEFEGTHHFKNLYKTIYLFLTDNGFIDTQDGGDLYEILYFEKVAQNGARDMHIWWRTKYPRISNPEFFELKIDIDFQVLYLSEAQKMKQNKKVKTNFADSIIRIRPTLVIDKKNILDRFPLRYFKNRYLYVWKRNRLDHAKEEMEFWFKKLGDVIKQYLELNQEGEEPPAYYFPAKGV